MAFSGYPELWINNYKEIRYVIIQKEIKKDENIKSKEYFKSISCNSLTLSKKRTCYKNGIIESVGDNLFNSIAIVTREMILKSTCKNYKLKLK